MLRTEEEAKRCWCPFVRQVSVVPTKNKSTAIGNRFLREGPALSGKEADDDAPELVSSAPDLNTAFNNPSGSRCIASECMAWRWGALEPLTDTPSPRRGYCGLAGKPD